MPKQKLRKINWDTARRYEKMFGGVAGAYCPPLGSENLYSAWLKNKHGQVIAEIEKTPIEILRKRRQQNESDHTRNPKR